MSNQHNALPSSHHHAGMLALIARGHRELAEQHLQKMPPTAFDTESQSGMVFYSPRDKIDPSSLHPLGDPSSLGGKVLSGDPKLYGRFDFLKGSMAAGLFMATTGKIQVAFPFTEHATILEGDVTITDEATGESYILKPGDSYFARQNQVMIWDVKGKYVIKSFFNVQEQSLP